MIEKEQNEIKEQIAGLFEQRNFHHDSKENKLLFWLAVLGLVEAIDTAVDLFFDIEACPFTAKLILFSLLIVGSLVWNNKNK